MEPAKIQGDKLEIAEPTLQKESFILGNRPIDVDQEKKHGDPLFDAASFTEPQPEVIHTGKLARELPEYHQGEARLRPAAVKVEPLPTEVLAAQAAALAENAKEIAEESKEFVEEKAHTLYDTAVKEADVLLEKAYEGEQYLLEKAVGAEQFLEEKGKQAYKKSEDILVNTIAPAVGYAIGSAYVALKSATGFAVEKGMEEAEYLKEKAAEIGEEVAKEAKILGEEALVKGSEMAHEAKILGEEAAIKGSELAKEAAVKGSELAKEAAVVGSEMAKEAAVKGSELAKEAAIKAQEGLAIASEVGKEALLSAAEKTDQTMEYLEKEAVHLSQEGMDLLNQQKEIVAEKIDHMAEEAKHNTEAAMLLRELADETEIKRKQELDEATRLRMKHDQAAHAAARKANFLQHEKAFEQDISSHLASSLRESHVEAEERALEEGGYEPLIDSPAIVPLERIADSPIMVVERDEMKPLLQHQAAIQVESRDMGMSQLPSSQLESSIPMALPTTISVAPMAPVTVTTVTTTVLPAAVPSVPIALPTVLPTVAPMVPIIPTGPNLAEAKYFPQLVSRMGSDAINLAPSNTFTN